MPGKEPLDLIEGMGSDDQDLSPGCLKLRIIAAQLRQVASAERSAEPPEENEDHRLPATIVLEGNVPAPC